jgi:hypothetical protein
VGNVRLGRCEKKGVDIGRVHRQCGLWVVGCGWWVEGEWKEEEGRVSFYGGGRGVADANAHYISNTMPREGKRSI